MTADEFATPLGLTSTELRVVLTALPRLGLTHHDAIDRTTRLFTIGAAA